MSSNIKIFLLCPVPDNQKPINELINFQQNFFNNILILSKKTYVKKFFQIYFLGFIICGSILFLNSGFKSFFSFFLFNFLTTNILALCIFFILFIRWSQLEDRFQNSRLFYEEGSWYDGQIWEKPLFLIKNDRLISAQKIQPIIQRISKIILILFYTTVFLLILTCY